MNKDTAYQTLTRLNKYSVCLIPLVLLAFSLITCAIAAPQEKIQVKQEMTFSAYEAAHWQTSVTTFNGNIYFVWVDDRLRTMIAKREPNGKITTNVILQKSEQGRNHSLPSVAVDKNGFIHVVYNMHHSTWQYKLSDKPEDIRSFTFIGNQDSHPNGIPGQKITYPSFAYDNNRKLYLTFRHRVHPDGKWGVGNQGIGIANYDTGTKRWRMLGGTDYKHGVKTFFWSNTARQEKGKSAPYQGYRAKIFFDRNNRMHVSWDVFINPGKEASHILYAYSDDGGQSFNKANGQSINSMPLTPQNGDIVEQAPHGIYNTRTYVSVTKDGRPIVSFKDLSSNKKTYYKIWNGNSWSNRKELPSANSNFIVDSNGVITAVENSKFSRSRDNGETWKSYPLNNSAESTVFDDAYLKQTGKLRFQTQVGNTVKVFTASFFGGGNSNQSTELTPPTGLRIIQTGN